MAWYDEAVFYHIYPLGLTGAPQHNSYQVQEPRLRKVFPWISHIKEIGCNAIYIGPLFESVGHGYETTDYKKLDSRLGTNQDLTDFVAECHRQGIRVILDGVFNHTGRDFFAFQDIKCHRENSAYKDWYCNVNFWGNTEYNDGFSYENWGGYNLLVKLNQHNPAVRDYICDVIRFWVKEFDIDGIRLDAADVLDFGYMQALRQVANEVKPEFWLMGEVIHGDYTRWVNAGTLHSVTNYHLHKALYSGHNDHNYFEIAHTVKRLYEMGGNRPDGLKLYNFVDNHDVERIYTKLNNKRHFIPVHVLLYTLPGVSSIYYGSEFGIEGRKEYGSDASLRPALDYEQYKDAVHNNEFTRTIAALGTMRQNVKALSYGDYKELLLTTCQYAFSRNWNGQSVLVTVNNGDNDFQMNLPAGNTAEYVGVLSGERIRVQDGRICVNVRGNSGEVWIPAELVEVKMKPVEAVQEKKDEVLTDAAATDVKLDESDVSVVEHAGAENANVSEDVKNDADDTQAEMCTECAEKSDASAVEHAGAESANVSEDVKDDAADVQMEKCAEKADDKAQGCVTGTNAATVTEQPTQKEPEKIIVDWNKPYEEMSIEELQEAILEKMRRNGPITDRMLQDVRENVYHNSLITWVKSFR